jgi:hypothetical protein
LQFSGRLDALFLNSALPGQVLAKKKQRFLDDASDSSQSGVGWKAEFGLRDVCFKGVPGDETQ